MAETPKQEDIDVLMKALRADAAKGGSSPSAPAAGGGAPPRAPGPSAAPEAGLEFLSDVEVNVRIELGTSRMAVQDVLKLGTGSVVPLESLVGDPVNVFVNDRLVAHGEVLVVNDNFAVRITEVIPLPKSEK